MHIVWSNPNPPKHPRPKINPSITCQGKYYVWPENEDEKVRELYVIRGGKGKKEVSWLKKLTS